MKKELLIGICIVSLISTVAWGMNINSLPKLAKRNIELEREQLTQAVHARDLSEVQELIKKGYSLNGQDSDGWTPLTLAIVGGDLPIVQELLNAGASLTPKTTKDIECRWLSIKAGSSLLDIALYMESDHGGDARKKILEALKNRIIIVKKEISKALLENLTHYSLPPSLSSIVANYVDIDIEVQ